MLGLAARLRLSGVRASPHGLGAMPTTLSGGERQRVAIARVLSGNPSLLLCDEPTGNLATHQRHVLDPISKLRQDGITIVIITHDPFAARRALRRPELRLQFPKDGIRGLRLRARDDTCTLVYRRQLAVRRR